MDQVWDVVVKENPRKNIFGGINGHGDFEEALVALKSVVDGDVLDSRVENRSMQQNEPEMPAGLSADLVGVDSGAPRGKVDCGNNVVNS